jgi:hypothetical protein
VSAPAVASLRRLGDFGRTALRRLGLTQRAATLGDSAAMSAARVPSDQPLPEQWLTPGVRGVGIASLLADLGHEVPTSLLPSLLTSTLGAPAAALGVIEGVSDALAGVARLGGGALADDPLAGVRSPSAATPALRCFPG